MGGVPRAEGPSQGDPEPEGARSGGAKAWGSQGRGGPKARWSEDQGTQTRGWYPRGFTRQGGPSLGDPLQLYFKHYITYQLGRVQ